MPIDANREAVHDLGCASVMLRIGQGEPLPACPSGMREAAEPRSPSQSYPPIGSQWLQPFSRKRRRPDALKLSLLVSASEHEAIP